MKKIILPLMIVLAGCQDNKQAELQNQIDQAELKHIQDQERLDRIKELMDAGYSYENAVKVHDETEKEIKSL